MWKGWRREGKGLGLAALGVHASGLSFVRVERPPRDRPRVSVAEFRPYAGNDPSKLLTQMAADHNLKRGPCTTVLNEGDYRLLQTEAPDVKAEELKAALRWRIKDLIDFHVNDATIDVFDVPIELPGRTALVYVVVGRNDAIRKRVDFMHDAGVALSIIDIPELAQRNLAQLLPEDREGVALLTLNEDGGCITITREGALFLSRTITGVRMADSDTATYERLLLELQRSLDYFESSFRQSPIMNVVIAPASTEGAALADFFKANLAQRVTLWEMDHYGEIEIVRPLPPLCLLTMGAALREEKVAL